MKLRAYFAHPMTDYGELQEEWDIKTIEKMGFEVVNPNGMLPKHLSGKAAMDKCLDIVEKCDILVFRAFPDGKISAGVATEIGHAMRFKKPVIELFEVLTISRRRLSVEETRQRIREKNERELEWQKENRDMFT